jgi:uncharacterized membrane protein
MGDTHRHTLIARRNDDTQVPPGVRAQQHAMNVRHAGAGRSRGERIADAVAARVVSWPFIVIQSALLALWIITNGFLIDDWLGGEPFDPYPFILLNLVLSFQAAYSGPVVLMSQNRQAVETATRPSTTRR